MASSPGIESANPFDAGFPLGELSIDRAVSLGEEAREVARLVSAAVRGFEGTIVSVRSDSTDSFEKAVREALATAGAVAVRPFFPTAGAARAFADVFDAPLDLDTNAS